MLTRRVIPCLDTRDGRVVKGVSFQALRDAGAPAERARRYEEDGADEIVLLDVTATTDRRAHALATVRAVREVLGIPLTVGGGVRTVEDAAALLGAGADKVAVNTAAMQTPDLLTELATRFGQQCITLSVDASARPDGEGWSVVIRAGTEWTDRGAVDWAVEGARLGAGEILLTSVDRDGTLAGYDLALTAAVARAVRVPVVASGGARGADDLVAALRAGADGALAASIFHDGVCSVQDIKQRMAEAGLEVRP
ncbi:MAG TPA: imidazole glycerol phosphate synthase subunit HisF [Gemmatimonadaceae bacterium]|jgi:imidazoleglycerol phosphate synthase cyclase subunit|nr:imidazole glycerol phosphate synthase subunit HisF [Gemmatimonadaceae bacterium]